MGGAASTTVDQPPVVGGGRKRIYFVRHAESLWNEGVATGNVVTMMGRTDHGLSQKGVKQAMDLGEKIRDGTETDFLGCEKLYSSPLKRAVQTALLILAQHPKIKGGITLLPVVRELRKQTTSRDNVASSRGDDIKSNALTDLEKSRRKNDLTSLSDVVVHVGDAHGDWWSHGTEDKDAVKQRITEFFTHLRTMDGPSCVVVTHSNFIRSILRSRAPKDVAKHLRSKKLPNCAVLAVDLDFGNPVGFEVVHLEFLFGTEPPQSPLMKRCASSSSSLASWITPSSPRDLVSSGFPTLSDDDDDDDDECGESPL